MDGSDDDFCRLYFLLDNNTLMAEPQKEDWVVMMALCVRTTTTVHSTQVVNPKRNLRLDRLDGFETRGIPNPNTVRGRRVCRLHHDGMMFLGFRTRQRQTKIRDYGIWGYCIPYTVDSLVLRSLFRTYCTKSCCSILTRKTFLCLVLGVFYDWLMEFCTAQTWGAYR